MFVTCCQRIQDNLCEGNQINRANDNAGETEGNSDETAVNITPNAHVKNVHKKPVDMESDTSLQDFEIW